MVTISTFSFSQLVHYFLSHDLDNYSWLVCPCSASIWLCSWDWKWQGFMNNVTVDHIYIFLIFSNWDIPEKKHYYLSVWPSYVSRNLNIKSIFMSPHSSAPDIYIRFTALFSLWKLSLVFLFFLIYSSSEQLKFEAITIFSDKRNIGYISLDFLFGCLMPNLKHGKSFMALQHVLR